ncbi:methyl-accepting chemotaxis protein [Roseospira marina]|nr:methyl-accepting chemotaxis protein [Roseospira marina]MBB4315332.1 hypothetical protein [Roseospira marina]MBB5088331.1 hypothetical protein [Roseospira marina]
MPHDATEWARRIDQTRAALLDLHGPCESGFVAIGEHLSVTHRATGDMAEAAAGLAEVLGATWITDVAGRLDANLGVLDATLKADAADTELRRMDEAVKAIRAAVQGLATMMGQVRMTAINARIEAAVLSDRTVDFSVFTREIGQLAAHGDASIQAVRTALDTLQTFLAKTVRLRGAFRQQHDGEMAAIGTQLEGAVATLRSRQQTARSTLDDIPAAMAQIRSAVSDMVGALQAADAIRQRLEHVEHALDTASDLLGQTARDDGPGSAHSAVVVNALCQLQAHQLAAIGAEFADKTEVIESRLTLVGDRIRHIHDGVQRIHAAASGDDGSFLSGLNDVLARADVVLRRYWDARHETETAMTRIATMSKDIAEALKAINEIDADMHVIGLNASIKCGNLGSRGRALNVVAVELQGFARRSRTIAGNIATALDSIVNASQVLSNQEGGETDTLLKDLDTVLRTFDEGVRTLVTQTDGRLHAVNAQAETLAGAVDRSVETFSIRQTMLATLGECQATLADIAQRCSPHVQGAALDAARKEALAFLSTHYTMADEREIHEALFQEGAQPMRSPGPSRPRSRPTSAPAPAPAPAAPGEPDISDLLF